MTINQENQNSAADSLRIIGELVIETERTLRTGVNDDLAYALVYLLRYRLGLIVTRLGRDMPSVKVKKIASEILDDWELDR